MKSSARKVLLAAFCLAAACSPPETAFFTETNGGALGAQPSKGGSDTGGSGSSNSGTQAGSSASGGTTSNQGGSASGGTTSQAGSSGSRAGSASDAGAAADPGAAGGANGGEPGEPPVVTPPVCGNGVIEEGEECDDGGHAGHDGCDSNCRVQCSEYDADARQSDRHHCYAGYGDLAFQDARQDCVRRKGHLATIASADENEFVQMFVNDSKWVGGFEDVAENAKGNGDYGWVSGEPFDYTNWDSGEPNREEYRCLLRLDPRCYEHCVAILGDGSWADRRCDMADGYVCEWDPPGTK